MSKKDLTIILGPKGKPPMMDDMDEMDYSDAEMEEEAMIEDGQAVLDAIRDEDPLALCQAIKTIVHNY